MRKILYPLAILMALFVTQNLVAELPSSVQVSDGSNEYWYYIQNAANPEMVYVNSSTINDNGNLDKAGFFMTSRGGNGSNQVYGYVYHINQNKDLQLWKLVDAGNSNYSLVNKKTGNKLALGTSTTAASCLGTDAANCGDLFYTNTDGNASYEVKLIGSKSNSVTIKRVGSTNKLLAFAGKNEKTSLYEAAIEDEYDLPQDTVITKSEKAWIFVSEAEMAARPYPQISTDSNEKWYTIDMISTNASYNGRVLYARQIPSTTEYDVFRAVRNESLDSHLWKFIAVPNDDAQVYIVNKSLPGKYMPYPATEERFNETEKAYLLKDIRNGQIGLMPADPLWNHGGVDGFSFSTAVYNRPIALATSNVDQTTARGYVSTFKFTPVDNPSGLLKIVSESFQVYVENGYIKVYGTDAPFKVYTISGQLVNANNQQPRGIYIVKVGTSSKKVIVQ